MLPRRPRCSRWLALRSPRPSIRRIAGVGGAADLPAASTSIMSLSPPARPPPPRECSMPPAMLLTAPGCGDPGLPGLPPSAMMRFKRMARTDLAPTESHPRRSSSACSVSLLSCARRSALLPGVGVPSGKPAAGCPPTSWGAEPPRRHSAAAAGGTASLLARRPPTAHAYPPAMHGAGMPLELELGPRRGGKQADREFDPVRPNSRRPATTRGAVVAVRPRISSRWWALRALVLVPMNEQKQKRNWPNRGSSRSSLPTQH